MKTIEEKARAYDEAIKKIKYVMEHGVQPVLNKEDLQEIFPEIQELEDEKIRKEIISALKYANHNGVYDKHLAWLEKQKSVEEIIERCKDSWYNEGKIQGMREGLADEEKYQQGWHDALEKQNEQKFKVGDWVVFNNNHESVYQIEKIENFQYILRYILGGSMPLSFSNENMIKHWTIQDAKPGDILFQDFMSGKTFIYDGINPDMAILYSFIINNDGEDVLPYNIGKPNTGIGTIEENKNIIYPATKEQRELLFQKMKEAGYEYNAKKKEQSKIEPNFNFSVGQWIVAYGKKSFLITKIDGFNVTLVDTNGDEYGVDASSLKNAHLWTIADAKDGDVLQLGRVTAIFQKYIGNGNCKCYCSVYDGEFEIPSQDIDDNSYGCDDAIPATKEQRDLLFQKMKEAGYEWDAEKKVPKSIKI